MGDLGNSTLRWSREAGIKWKGRGRVPLVLVLQPALQPAFPRTAGTGGVIGADESGKGGGRS